MASRFRKTTRRLSEFESASGGHGRINLVPLVDVLTSIVFFSLLTYTGAEMANLTAFDLTLPPVVVTASNPGANAAQPDTTTLILSVLIHDGKLRVEHSGNGGFVQEIAGTSGPALDSLQAVLTNVKRQYPDNNDINVVPDDGVAYDDIVHVLERAKMANFKNISLGSAARATQVASAGGY